MRRLCAAVLAAGVVFAVRSYADLEGSYLLPLDHPAIQYATAAASDPISKLQSQLAAGNKQLKWDEQHGYLPAMLSALGVPASSQVLVFSKTSFQAPRIAPRTPRALYFNDEVTVGWVMGGDVVELTAVDPQLGVMFYTLDQERVARPSIQRRGECLQCHASGGTLGVPGLVVRSVFPEASGMPLFHAGGFVTDHRSPLKERWGGWYVTGTHGEQRHLGNLVVADRERPREVDVSKGANVTDLKGRFDTGAYLTPHSDIVALMVLEHQTRMTNLITRVGFETRMALHNQRALNRELGEPANHLSDSTRRRIENAANELVKYTLFLDEAPLEGAIRGTSGYAAEFEQRGPRDRSGRSLRQLDLTKRLLRYPCSFLIYSDAFDGLPAEAKDHVYRRMFAILSGAEKSRMAEADRRAVLEILRETKRGLPAYWTRS